MGVVAQSLPEKARELFSEDALPAGFEWVAWLSPRNMRLFAIELNAALANPEHLALQALIDSWIATAELDHATEVQEEMERNRRGSFKAVDPAWLKKKLSTP